MQTALLSHRNARSLMRNQKPITNFEQSADSSRFCPRALTEPGVQEIGSQLSRNCALSEANYMTFSGTYFTCEVSGLSG